VYGSVHDLTVTGAVNITGTGGSDVVAGGVAGMAFPASSVRNVASSVTVTVGGGDDVFAGGVLGVSQGAVSNVYATGAVSAKSTGAKKEVYAGGIAGATTGGVSYAYATGDISATGTGDGGRRSRTDNLPL